ncbi:MAG: HAD-IIB family hydrolase [Desulfobacterales bacterium]|nr:HAD-IIB family hydrolase [Desulfobacterales bacterium]
MYQPKLLLCTDMDRTVIPNGIQPEHPDARKRFRKFCKQPGVSLVYVTGRHQTLVKQAIKNFVLPEPDFVITDVGTKIYQVIDDKWLELRSWEEEIDKDWHGKNREQIQQLLSNITELNLQENSKQNTHKLSYYLPMNIDKDKVIHRIEKCLNQEGIAASVIWSIDEPKDIGLLDVIPRNATKLHAIEFLQQRLRYKPHEVIFAGDSGNDLPVLCSRINSVLVANAGDEIKKLAQHSAEQNGQVEALYIARADKLNMNGNYSAGVLQGVWHFAPDFRDALRQAGIFP